MIIIRKMKADFNPQELEKAFAFVCKGLRPKKARDSAKAPLVLRDNDIGVEFNGLSTNCVADVSETGRYAVNPFIFRPFLETFGKNKITMEIDREGITIARLHLTHIRVHGRFEDPDEAIGSWKRFRSKQVGKQQKRIERDAEWKAVNRLLPEDKLRDARYVAFKRIDGGIEYGAAVLKYEKGEPGNRKVYVKTKDFQEVWINELDIVSYRKDPELSMN